MNNFERAYAARESQEMQRMDRDAERAEHQEAQIEVRAAELFQEYITDEDMIVDTLLKDTDVLWDMARAFLSPEVDKGNVYNIIRKYVSARAEEDAREMVEDR